jgi:hypothetical protein
MQLEDLKSDDYYYAEYIDINGWCIVKGSPVNGRRPNIYINSINHNQSYSFDNSCAAKKNIRLATEEEIHWLDCCIEKNEFIEFEEAMKTFIPFRKSNPEADKNLEPIYKKLLNL